MPNDNEEKKESGTRRASDSTQLMLVNSGTNQGNPRLSHAPFPLPYLASDYLPSPGSPKQLVISPNHTADTSSVPVPPLESNYLIKSGSRQRSQSFDQTQDQTDQPRLQRRFLALESSHPQGNLDLIPYREWTVISRNDANGQMVLFNPESCRVIVQRYLPDNTSNNNTSDVPLSPVQIRPNDPSETGECPLCHQPVARRNSGEPNVMDRNYFRLLASASSSEQPSGQTPLLPSFSAGNIKLNTNAFNQGYYEKFFVQLRKLGRGFRGSVFLCEHLLDGVRLGKYAVKKVAIGNNHSWLVKMLREVHLLERLRHPNIINYKHAWLEYSRLTPFGPEVPCLFILMECANGGNLEEYIQPEVSPQLGQEAPAERRKSTKELKRERIKRQLHEQEIYETETSTQPVQVQKRLLSMNEIWSMFLDIVEGLSHLHLQHIVHRDLKPPNLLLKWDVRSREGVGDWNEAVQHGIPRVLISDFGECEDLEETLESDRTGATGTLEFMAPEHVRLDPRGRNRVEYSSKADMWSLGMVLYYLCYSRLPYKNVIDVDILRDEILAFRSVTFPTSRYHDYENDEDVPMSTSHDQSIPDDIPQELKILIRMLLSVDPDKRPSCEEILSRLRDRRPENPAEFSFSEWTYPRFDGLNTEVNMTNESASDEDAVHPVENVFLTASDSNKDVEMDDLSKKRSSASASSTTSMQRRASLRKRQKLASSSQSRQNESGNSSPSTIASNSHLSDTESPHALLMDAQQTSGFSMENWWRDHTPNERQYLDVLKIVTVVLKIASCTQVCSPYSTRPAVLYPVIILATLDFWSAKASHSLLLVGIHVLWVITAALVTGGMCVA